MRRPGTMAALVAALAYWSAGVMAAAPDMTPRPVMRGGAEALSQPVQSAALSTQSALRSRPLLRPDGLVPVPPLPMATPWQQGITSDDIAANTRGVLVSRATVGFALSPRPFLRPPVIVEKAMAKRRARRKGAVCGDPDIQGEAVGLVPGRIRGCGVKNAVRVRSVLGVGLSQQSVMDCGTAKALKRWMSKGMMPAVGNYGGGVSGIRVAAHYACRTRNNRPGAKISEHGKGRAIDISGIKLRDGSELSVLRDWNLKVQGRILKRMHKAACGPFGTVLGPNSDRYHRDHFHFDTARYRSGSYCR